MSTAIAASAVGADLWGEWRGQAIGEMISRARELTEDMEFPTVRRWRERGGQVLGHFQVYFPEELAHAAGMLPVKVKGGPVEMRQADAHFGSYLCSVMRSSLELGLSGHLPLDMFVTHPICDAARNLAGVWARNFSYPIQILYLPQNPNSASSVEYLRAEYQRLLSDIEGVTGAPVGVEALRASIAIYNRNRALIRDLYAMRREAPWMLGVDEAYVLLAVGTVMRREEHNEMLAAALAALRERPARRQDKMRVVFEGGFCEQPPVDLLSAMAQSCYVVDDDLLIGLRYLEHDVPLTGDPLGELADAYINDSTYSPVQHDLRKPKEQMLLRRIAGARADAAIIAAAKMCEPGLDEQVAYSQALEEAHIPFFVTEFEEKMSNSDQLQIQLETFVENIVFD
jgi:benzoyl-CoA reductase subunit C